ncbi:DgyrCDS5100 [Dimorphilus gyrociliatus]|uniref:DgyrCDS5100 n=1 Tax=Dimorphilus gyrociliatus TaxID=2664684 RepID=A0A7I8VIS8_9ANNE|nr:DgyrCDS5100 [Dimorphilus gyrociliatus]
MAAPIAIFRRFTFTKNKSNILLLSRRLFGNSQNQFKEISPFTTNHAWTIDEEIKEQIIKEEMNARRHTGSYFSQPKALPKSLRYSLETVIESFGNADIDKLSKDMNNLISSRKVPLEKDEILEILQEIENEVMEQEKMSPEHLQSLDDRKREKHLHYMRNKIMNIARKRSYRWKEIEYTLAKALAYAKSRLHFEYSCLSRIFFEMKKRDENFRPQTLFDFGSGVGSVMWACNDMWPKSIFEHFCVEKSSSMIELADLLLRDGNEAKERCFKNVNFKSYMPKDVKGGFDICVSSFSLLHLTSREERLSTLNQLWKLTDEYLVLVENGNLNGFKVINEARDFILNMSKIDQDQGGYVYSPCPHDLGCPRMKHYAKPLCPFSISYRKQLETPVENKKFCYLIMKKGKRRPEDVEWPRLMDSVKNPPRQAVCHMCTASGELQTAVITKAKHGKTLYHCVRNGRSGDLLPMVPAENTKKEP